MEKNIAGPEFVDGVAAPDFAGRVSDASDKLPPGKGTAEADGWALVGFICGICGVVFSWTFFLTLIAIVLSVIAVVFSSKARGAASPSKKGLATAGLVLGIVGICVGGISLLFGFCALWAARMYGGGMLFHSFFHW